MKVAKSPAGNRGHIRLDWLESRHTFSFASYQDPARMGLRALRVLNDDFVEPGRGAEILIHVIAGQPRHEDSMGNSSVIEAGDLQYMSAGDGVRDRFNPSRSERVRLLLDLPRCERRRSAPTPSTLRDPSPRLR